MLALLSGAARRSPCRVGGAGVRGLTIKMAGLGRKTRSIEEQMAKLKEKVSAVCSARLPLRRRQHTTA
jgi:hypothetical protein